MMNIQENVQHRVMDEGEKTASAKGTMTERAYGYEARKFSELSGRRENKNVLQVKRDV